VPVERTRKNAAETLQFFVRCPRVGFGAEVGDGRRQIVAWPVEGQSRGIEIVECGDRLQQCRSRLRLQQIAVQRQTQRIDELDARSTLLIAVQQALLAQLVDRQFDVAGGEGLAGAGFQGAQTEQAVQIRGCSVAPGQRADQCDLVCVGGQAVSIEVFDGVGVEGRRRHGRSVSGSGGRGTWLAGQQHRVAVTEEAIALADCVPIGAADGVDTGESRNQHQ
jgi:hypothetical protein